MNKTTEFFNNHEWLKRLLLIAAMLLIILISDVGCVYKRMFGIDCPGCGMTRAWFSFFKGDLHQALVYHPLFWSVPIIFGVVIFEPYIKSKKVIPIIAVIFAISFIGVYLIRLMTNTLP